MEERRRTGWQAADSPWPFCFSHYRGAKSAGLAQWQGTESAGGTPWSPRGTATTEAGLPGAGPLALQAVLDAPSQLRAGAVPPPEPSSDRARLLGPACPLLLRNPQGRGKNHGSNVLSPLLPPSSNLSRCFVVGVARLFRRHFGAPRTQTRGKEVCWQWFLSSFLPVLLSM